MGRQINFFLHGDDQPDFDRLLKTCGDVVLLPYYHHDNNVSTIEDSLIWDVTTEGRRVYIIRRSDFKNIPLTHIEKFGYWLIDDLALPIVHFDRGVTKIDKIERGRIYFQPDFVDSKEMRMVKKSDDFIKWADNIIRTVRRKLKKYKHNKGAYSYTEYLGDHANKWRELNRAEIAAAGAELKSSTSTRI
jgi:hypothetical protein